MWTFEATIMIDHLLIIIHRLSFTQHVSSSRLPVAREAWRGHHRPMNRIPALASPPSEKAPREHSRARTTSQAGLGIRANRLRALYLGDLLHTLMISAPAAVHSCRHQRFYPKGNETKNKMQVAIIIRTHIHYSQEKMITYWNATWHKETKDSLVVL